jgi:hypothetical protein
MAAQHPVDPMTCNGLPEAVEEDGLIGHAIVNEVYQHVGFPYLNFLK